METNNITKDNEIIRQRCTIWTRTMGYIRNFGSMNPGKKTEHYSRKYYLMPDLEKNPILQARENAKFNNKYE